jgi:hypothetical protein
MFGGGFQDSTSLRRIDNACHHDGALCPEAPRMIQNPAAKAVHRCEYRSRFFLTDMLEENLPLLFWEQFEEF